MKSRLLTMAAAVFLLLGLSTSAFAQVTSADAVDFYIRTYQSDGDLANAWHNTSGTTDTVGRQMDVQAEWAIDAQSLSSVNYTVTFPVGTVLMAGAKDSVIMRLYSGFTRSGTPQSILIDPADIALVLNDTASYSGSTRPSATITSTILFNDDKLLLLEFYKDVYIGGLQSDVNSELAGTAMIFSLNISSQVGTTFDDTDLMAINDLADGVKFNTSIGGYIDDADVPFPSGDSIIIVDRFGNNVPDYYATGDDSLVISVPAAAGYWSVDSVDNAIDGVGGITAWTSNIITHAGLTEEDSTKIVIRFNAGLINAAPNISDLVFRDGTSTYLLLGMRVPGAVATGGAGLAFDGDATTDSTTFTVTLYGNVAENTVINTPADNTSSITRARLPAAAGEQLGSLVISGVTIGGPTYVGGRLDATFTITLKNIFGESFSGTPVVGTDTDPVAVKFIYEAWDNDAGELVIDATKTGYLASGKTANSVYTTPAATFDNTNMGTDVFDGSSFEPTLAASAVTISAGNTNLPIYFGMASHPADTNSVGKGDSIAVVFYATNSPAVNDTVKIKVEPGSPVAFDTDAFVASLAGVTPIKGLPIDTTLPIVALDTSYNQVANFSLVTATNVFLDAIDIPNTGSVATGEGHGLEMAINFLIDGRDPQGYDDAVVAVRDSIRFDNIGLQAGVTANAADSSYIAGFAQAAASGDSATINLGGTGDDALGLSLLYTGNNRRLSIEWDPAAMGSGYDPGKRMKDLGLISLADQTLVDSLNTPTITMLGGGNAGRTDTMKLTVVLPVSIDGTANVLDQNSADSLIILKLVNFGDAAGLTTTSVSISADDNTYYSAGGVYQGDGDSVAFSVPITFNATSTAQTIYIKVWGIVNPTIADSANFYKVMLASSATPVFNTTSLTINDDTLAQYALIPPSGDQDTVRAGVKWLSDIDMGDAVDTLTVGDTAWFQIVVADQYGNLLGGSAGDNISANKLIFTSVDSTLTGADLVVFQKYDDVLGTVGSGEGMYDSLAAGLILKDGGNYADSIGILAGSTNGGVDYTITLSDTTGAATGSSVTVYVNAGAAAAITLDPDSLVTGNRGANLPTLTATLADANGNPVVAGTVSFGLAYGDTTGAFADTNSVDLAADADSVDATTDAAGKALATWRAGGAGDSVAIAVWATGVSAVYFNARTQFTGAAGVINIVSPTDSLVPNLTTAGTITANVLDADLVTAVYLNVWRSELTLGADNTFEMSDAVAFDSVVGVAVASLDSSQVSLALPDTVAVDTAVVIKYQIVAVDAVDSVTYSDTMMYVVAPTRGKRNMTDDAVNVADVMRLVYLIAIDEIVPKLVDYFGLDLDQDGAFLTADLVAELAIWRGTGTLLAGVSVPEDASAKAELSYEATGKSTANLALNLETSDNLNMAVFRIKYDTEKFIMGEATATERLKGVSVVTGNNTKEGIYTIVLVNIEGGRIVKGNGAILNIAISATGDKFDGVGEISLLNAGFEEGVAVELSREVLSPKALLPKDFALSNFPNPFNPSTTIAYDIPEGDNVQVQLKVYNIRGQLVRTLVNESKSEGSYQIQWDGSDNYGRKVSSGVYFYRIKAGEFSQTRKMVILK
ncbi:MAG: T9SS type A sorting domain-containing protein [Candidatus Glassbacteria bacterium]|nr:T9SS type A sorting domain-containing protein [Candidatus Glassbacteria bacterium]